MIFTSDISLFSEPISTVVAADACAINCTKLDERVERLIRESVAKSTRRAYRSDLRAFAAWGGTIPASPEMVAGYIADHAGILAVASIQRRLASISRAHNARRLPNPVRSELVAATMRGLRRTDLRARKEAKALTRDDLFAALDALGTTIRDRRDRALLLIGFAGGFRRCELIGLDVADITAVRQGIIVTLRRSKTDQERKGRHIGIPHGRTRHCPIKALEEWLLAAGIESGPIFRSIGKGGRVSAKCLSGEAVPIIVRERLAAAGIDPAGFSGHSLRAGFVTTAVQVGASTHKIRQTTGHASDAMLGRYVRDTELFVDNAASALL